MYKWVESFKVSVKKNSSITREFSECLRAKRLSPLCRGYFWSEASQSGNKQLQTAVERCVNVGEAIERKNKPSGYGYAENMNFLVYGTLTRHVHRKKNGCPGLAWKPSRRETF